MTGKNLPNQSTSDGTIEATPESAIEKSATWNTIAREEKTDYTAEIGSVIAKGYVKETGNVIAKRIATAHAFANATKSVNENENGIEIGIEFVVVMNVAVVGETIAGNSELEIIILTKEIIWTIAGGRHVAVTSAKIHAAVNTTKIVVYIVDRIPVNLEIANVTHPTNGHHQGPAVRDLDRSRFRIANPQQSRLLYKLKSR